MVTELTFCNNLKASGKILVMGTRVMQKVSEEDQFMTTDGSVILMHCQCEMKLTRLIQLMMKNCTNSNLFITRASEQDLSYHHSVSVKDRKSTE